jgi:antibiotic biosynthesis monooxygenase (ABM) superfamily enzyme
MSVTVQTISTKPAGVVWFRQSSPENAAAWDVETAWTAAQTGFIATEHIALSENVSSFSVTFDVVENYRAWRHARDLTAYDIARVAYYAGSGITYTSTYAQG